MVWRVSRFTTESLRVEYFNGIGIWCVVKNGDEEEESKYKFKVQVHLQTTGATLYVSVGLGYPRVPTATS